MNTKDLSGTSIDRTKTTTSKPLVILIVQFKDDIQIPYLISFLVKRKLININLGRPAEMIISVGESIGML